MSEKTTNPKSSGITQVTAPFYKILVVTLALLYISKSNGDPLAIKIMYICLLVIAILQIYGIVYFFKNRKNRPYKTDATEEN